ncbi:hypothetical protein Tcur_4576 [Thermomonospora curvata DSM 43183]|uniref:Uncharacterized protein n=1 Tax=Thermomonospora curvata (strain ATCC 19995 / DSM 43183 / JCM 3096 / KCTC 9072 / NBRC 15933 / NCIMB 10081 / Henssen B9) TaxID=471852 RepID=D1A5B2_THECD|nr:hypothetical protein Tcur_4576 [Thermomonospora curvata DSM 43183]
MPRGGSPLKPGQITMMIDRDPVRVGCLRGGVSAAQVPAPPRGAVVIASNYRFSAH